MFDNKKVAAVVVAAGRGLRMGTDRPKQYLTVAGKPIICRTLEKFQQNNLVDEIILVVHKDEIEFVKKNISKNYDKIKKVVKGGNTRTESVYNGLKSMQDCDIVLIHDGVRPFISHHLIENCIETAAQCKSCIPTIPVVDTLKEVHDDFVDKTVDRNTIRAVQTPQSFDYNLIMSCYDKAITEDTVFTDDASIVEHYGYKVKSIDGLVKNIKITTQLDLRIAEVIASIV